MKLDLRRVTRVEVIDARGRAMVRQNLEGAAAELADGGRTLKVFVSGDEAEFYAARVVRHGLERPVVSGPENGSESRSWEPEWGETEQLADE
jgi:hypothetical protein